MAMIRPETEMKDSGDIYIGKIPSNWRLASYRYFADSGMGLTILKEEVTDLGVPIYSATQDSSIFGYINNPKLKLGKGDLVIPARGNSIGCTTYVEDDVATCTQTTIYSKVSGINSKYLFYCSIGLKEEWFYYVQTAIPQITVSQVQNNKVPLPPLFEQQAIADYLDKSCAKIDEIIAEAKASIDEYKELRLSVLTSATTKGLSDAVKYKDSGSRWVDKIPSNWSKMKIHYIIDMPVIDGPHVSPELVGEGVDYISANAIVDGKIDFSKRRGYITREYSNECRKRYSPQKNDILVVKLGASTGKMAMVGDYTDFDIWVPIAVVRCKKEVNAKYVYYSMSSKYFKDEIKDGWTFGTQETLGVKTLESLHVFLPSRVEQDEIVRYLDEQLPKYDSLIAEKESLINDLEAYKKSLIYEVVTGKRRVV